MAVRRSFRWAGRLLRPGCLTWAGAFAAASILVLWAAAPDLARWGIEYAGARAGFSARADSVRIDPIRGAIELRGVRVEASRPSALSHLEAAHLRVRFSLRRLIAEGIGGIVEVRGEGVRIDIDPAAAPASRAPEGGAPPAFALPPIEILDGELSVRAGARTLRFAGIDISLAGGAGRARLAGIGVDGGLSPDRDPWLGRRLPVWIAIDRIDLAGIAASRIELGAGETLRDVRIRWGDGPLRGSLHTDLAEGEAKIEAALDGGDLSLAIRARGIRAEAIPDLLPELIADRWPSAGISFEARIRGPAGDPLLWRAEATVDAEGAIGRTWRLDRLRGALALRDEGLEIPGFEAAIGGARAEIAGALSRDGRVRARVDLSVTSVRDLVARCDLLRGIEGLEGVDGTLSISTRIDGDPGRIEDLRSEGRVSAREVRLREATIRGLDASWTLGDRRAGLEASFSTLQAAGRISATATLEPPAEAPRPGDAKPIAGFRRPLPPLLPRLADAQVASLELDLEDTAVRLIDPIRIDGKGGIDPFRIRAAGYTIHAEGRHGLADPRSPWVDLSIRSEEIDLSLLEDVGPPIRRAAGGAIARARLVGPVREPRIEAEVELRGGEIAFEGIASPLRSVEGRARLEGDRIILEGVRGRYGGGTISIGGGARLSGPPLEGRGIALAELDLGIEGRNLLLARSSDLLLRADADLRWLGPVEASELRGIVRVARGLWSQDWRPSLRSRPIPRELPRFEDPILGRARFDIAFEPDRKLHLKNRLIDVRPEGRVFLRGTGAEPVLAGSIETTAGTVAFAKAKLSIRSAVISMREGAPLDPALDLRLEGEVAEYRIAIDVTGTLDAPRVDLASDPPLPKEEILALMATGRTSPGGREGARATALALAEYFGPDLVMHLFGIRAGGEGSFLSRFTLENRSLREGDVWRLRFDISNRFAVQAERGYFGDYNLDLLYRIRLR